MLTPSCWIATASGGRKKESTTTRISFSVIFVVSTGAPVQQKGYFSASFDEGPTPQIDRNSHMIVPYDEIKPDFEAGYSGAIDRFPDFYA